MPSFVDEVLSTMSSTTVNFLTDFVGSYWGTLLGVGAIIAIGTLFIRLGKFGRR